jgi:hypothetical protein
MKYSEMQNHLRDLTCVYCLRNVPISGFNTEHVILQALGSFENNLTLNQLVCRECNQFFGDNLDRIFARDSFEAYDRIKQGLKRAAEIADLPQERLTFTVAQEGEWNGLRLRLVAPDGLDAVELVPQVGLPKKGQLGWIFLTEAELADPDRSFPAEVDTKGQIRVIAPSAEVQQRLVDLLARKGVLFTEQRALSLPGPAIGEIEIYVNTKVDPIVKRCVAKMVFNYLAYVTSREFVLLPSFDAIRAYIRRGESPGYLLVAADDRPILRKDSRTQRQTAGNLVTVNWTGDRRHVVGQFSPFNRVTYRVSLARDFSGLWRPIRSGHHFDLGTRTVTLLAGTSLHVPGASPR